MTVRELTIYCRSVLRKQLKYEGTMVGVFKKLYKDVGDAKFLEILKYTKEVGDVKAERILQFIKSSK